jgi:long-chain acyl-CoA synthetase
MFSLLLYVFSSFMNTIDYFLSFFFGSQRKGSKMSSKVIDFEPVEGEGNPRVHSDILGKSLTQDYNGQTTIAEIFETACKKFSNNRCVGRRNLKEMHKRTVTTEDGKVKDWYTPEFHDVEWCTYEAFFNRVCNFATGLLTYGNLNSGDFVLIYENTRPKWMIAAQACFRNSITVVTSYSNLGNDALEFSINQTKVTCVICNGSNVKKLLDASSRIPSIKTIIYIDDYKEKMEPPSGVKVISFEECEAYGKANSNTKSIKLPSKETMAIIMYTSGTTGDPKGVEITHNNVVCSVSAFSDTISSKGMLEKEVFLAYLPLAHIFEIVVEITLLANGASIGYGTPRTLSDATAKPCGDLKAIRPTLLIGVPRIYETIKKGALEKVHASGAVKTWIFNTAFANKLAAIKSGRSTPLWDHLVFNQFKENLGGRCSLVVSGAAPLSPSTHEFLTICFCCPVVQGYGLTETCSASTVQDASIYQVNTGNVGYPLKCNQIKLVDVPDLGYFSTDKPYPRGEIWIKGGNVSSGYYMEPEKTRDAYTNDGWFMTGDIGIWLEDGALRIIDRKKNLVKLGHGEYVALEHLESIYGNSPFVSPNGLMVYGDSFRNSLVGLMIPQESYLKSWAKENGIKGDYSELCKNPTVVKTVMNTFKQLAADNKKKSFEEIKAVTLYADEWTPENGLLTSSMKMKRATLVSKYEKDINDMYARVERN